MFARQAAGACCLAGDILRQAQCQVIIRRALDELGGVDILVNNDAFQTAHKSLQDFLEDELDRTSEPTSSRPPD